MNHLMRNFKYMFYRHSKGKLYLISRFGKISLFSYNIILIIIFINACNPFAPPYISDDQQSTIQELYNQDNPSNVLTKFQYAYTFKDSLMYIDILDSSFVFVSANYHTSTPTEIRWGRDIDIKTTIGLFRHFNVIELIWGDTLRHYIEDSSGEIKISFQLTFDGGREFPTITGEALFYFTKKNNDQWYITRWEDTASF